MKVIYKNAVISTETINSVSTEKNADFEISEAGSPSQKSIIKIETASQEIVVALFWSASSGREHVSVHWVEASKILFIGAGSVSAVINMDKMELVNLNYPDLFWDWECIEDYVLELGELACRLYDSTGILLGEVPVDPPYQYQVVNDAIKFSSIVMGEKIITFHPQKT